MRNQVNLKLLASKAHCNIYTMATRNVLDAEQLIFRIQNVTVFSMPQ